MCVMSERKFQILFPSCVSAQCRALNGLEKILNYRQRGSEKWVKREWNVTRKEEEEIYFCKPAVYYKIKAFNDKILVSQTIPKKIIILSLSHQLINFPLITFNSNKHIATDKKKIVTNFFGRLFLECNVRKNESFRE